MARAMLRRALSLSPLQPPATKHPESPPRSPPRPPLPPSCRCARPSTTAFSASCAARSPTSPSAVLPARRRVASSRSWWRTARGAVGAPPRRRRQRGSRSRGGEGRGHHFRRRYGACPGRPLPPRRVAGARPPPPPQPPRRGHPGRQRSRLGLLRLARQSRRPPRPHCQGWRQRRRWLWWARFRETGG